MSEELLSEELKQSIEATTSSSSRGRRVLIVLITASVLAFGAFWNSRQGSWINSRVRVASGAEKLLRLNKEYYAGGTTEQRKEEIVRELQSKIYDEPKRFISIRGLQTSEELDPLIKKVRDIQTERVMFIHVPFFGVLFDINDLGMLGGFAFVVLLMWFRFSLWHESSNLKTTFAKATEKNCLPLSYELLSMHQVLTVPCSLGKDRPRQRPWGKIALLLFFLPSAVQLTVLAYDAYSFEFGSTISLFNTIVSIAVSLAFLVLIIILTVYCVELSREIERTWKKAFAEVRKLGKTVFRLKGHSDAKSVTVAGSFNDWDPSQHLMVKRGGEWVCDMNLPRGEHKYKFIVDGKWKHDPGNARIEEDSAGNKNSLTVVE